MTNRPTTGSVEKLKSSPTLEPVVEQARPQLHTGKAHRVWDCHRSAVMVRGTETCGIL